MPGVFWLWGIRLLVSAAACLILGTAFVVTGRSIVAGIVFEGMGLFSLTLAGLSFRCYDRRDRERHR